MTPGNHLFYTTTNFPFQMTHKVNLDNVAVVLQRPRYPENIGATARSMRNMGIRRLIVVEPENFDVVKILKMATHAASDVVKAIDVYENLQEALAGFQYVAGTTARLGGERLVITGPPKLAQRLISVSQENRVAILFGPEDRGLSNEDIRFCHALVNIPTAEFSSLNLAQAVMVMCYEIFTAELKTEETSFTPRLASRHELDGMYEQLKDILVRISFINAENPDYWLNNMRHFFNRFPLRAKEVRMIRGICRQINWYGKKCYEDGKQER
jgi:tRNA/rRNA methyltransferase